MIIGYYPGAGGNRYYLYSQGQRDFKSNFVYDQQFYENKGDQTKFRYLSNDTIGLESEPIILTHCVNVPLLKQHWPDRPVVIIHGNLDKCIRREWVLAGQQRANKRQLDDPMENAQSTISYHLNYYAQYPLDTTGADLVIDIDTDLGEFAQMMKQELELSSSDIFDRTLTYLNRLKAKSLAELPTEKVEDGFKSKFLDDAEKMRMRLDEYSPSLCLAKWKQVSLHLPTGLNNSCYHPPLHRIPIEDITRSPSALHNTTHKKEQRRLMLNGKRPSECSYCWNMEDLGNLSDRFYRSGEPWAAKDFGKIVSAEWTDNINPSYVEVNFNHACNLKCSYCSPQFSSSWQDEIDRFGAYPTSTPHNAPEHFVGHNKPIPVREDNPYVDAFWKWWPELYPELEHFRMTGGEPLMDKNTYKVFDYVLENPNPKLHLNVTSNFSVEQRLFDRYLDYVKKICNGQIEHFMQYVSLDAWGSQAEYIRHGMDFDLVWSRVDQYLTQVPSYNSLTFIVTMNNLSVTSFQKLLNGILELRKKHSKTYQRVWFDTPVLRQPSWQSLQILPESYACVLESSKTFMSNNLESNLSPFQGFKDYEVQRLERDISWMRQKQLDDHSTAKGDFYQFFSEHDRRRGTSFLTAFPEMQSWWAECEYHAKKR